MSSAMLPRLALRQTRWAVQRRCQSSTAESAKEAVSEKATQAKEGASQAATQAQQGLSRVTSSASNIAGSAANAAGKAVSGIGGRTGAAIGWVQGMIPPTLYYARVGGELAKIIYRGRSMSPPTVESVQGYLQPLTKAIRNPSSYMSSAGSTAETAATNPQSFLTRLRNMESDTLIGTGIVAAEVLGFFCIGEMIGRFKIVGYRGGHAEHH